jgi:hypothetical protein
MRKIDYQSRSREENVSRSGLLLVSVIACGVLAFEKSVKRRKKRIGTPR